MTKRKPNTTADGELACAFGEKWIGPHPLCRQHTAEVCGCAVEDVPDPDLSHLMARHTREDFPHREI